MTYNNEEYVSPHWEGFRSLWWIVAIILLLSLLLLWLMGLAPGGNNCQVPVEIVEKVVETEKVIEGEKPVEVPAVIAEVPEPTVQVNAAICEFNPITAKADMEVTATCTGIETGGSVSIAGMNCGEEMSGIVFCTTGNSEDVGTNPTVTTLGASGKSIDGSGDFSLLIESPVLEPEPEIVETPSARIYFDVSSDKLSVDKSNRSLEPVITYLLKNNGAIAHLSGFHDPSGNLQSNRDLAKRRAQSVSQVLQAAGISSERITLEKPTETTGSGEPEEARRVEVAVEDKQ